MALAAKCLLSCSANEPPDGRALSTMDDVTDVGWVSSVKLVNPLRVERLYSLSASWSSARVDEGRVEPPSLASARSSRGAASRLWDLCDRCISGLSSARRRESFRRGERLIDLGLKTGPSRGAYCPHRMEIDEYITHLRIETHDIGIIHTIFTPAASCC